jgi:hypothetical protein
MSIFTAELLAVLPRPVRGKIQRLEADPSNHAYLTRAANYLRYHGAVTRHATHGIRPAHVVPELEPVRDHAAAVADVRQRIADIDTYVESLPGKVAASELLDVWADVFATDASLARLAWERIEESIICDAEDAGICINRRADLDPAAFLEIERA